MSPTDKREPRAVQHPAQHVPALGVRSEEEPAPRVEEVGIPQIALERVERGDPGRQDGRQHHQGHQDQAELKEPVAAQALVAAPQKPWSSRDVGYPAGWEPRTPLHRWTTRRAAHDSCKFLPGERYASHLNPGKRVNPDRPFTLVLSGGGLKGLAHIGVFRALEERGLAPSLVVGSSIGSLIGAAWAAGATPDRMEARALRVRRRDVFQVARVDVALRRLLAPALYRREPLDALVASLVGDITFRDLKRRLLVNTTDLHTGMQVMWGLPGLLDARVADAVTASCALPGIFPPREIGGRAYVDGAVVENLPVRLAASLGSGSDHRRQRRRDQHPAARRTRPKGSRPPTSAGSRS